MSERATIVGRVVRKARFGLARDGAPGLYGGSLYYAVLVTTGDTFEIIDRCDPRIGGLRGRAAERAALASG